MLNSDDFFCADDVAIFNCESMNEVSTWELMAKDGAQYSASLIGLVHRAGYIHNGSFGSFSLTLQVLSTNSSSMVSVLRLHGGSFLNETTVTCNQDSVRIEMDYLTTGIDYQYLTIIIYVHF